METNTDISISKSISYKHNNGEIHTVSNIEDIKCPVIGALSEDEKKLFLEIYSDLNTKRIENEINYETEEEISDSQIFELKNLFNYNKKNDTDVTLERLHEHIIINEIEKNNLEPTLEEHIQSKNIEIIEPNQKESIPEIKNVKTKMILEVVDITKDNAKPTQEIPDSNEPILETKLIDEISINIDDDREYELVQNPYVYTKKPVSTIDKLVTDDTKLEPSNLIEIIESPVIENVKMELFSTLNHNEPTLINEVNIYNKFSVLPDESENITNREINLDEIIKNYEFNEIYKADSDIESLISVLVEDDNIVETLNEELDQIKIDFTEPLEVVVEKIADIVYEILFENNLNCPEEIINILSKSYAIKHVINQQNKDKFIYDKSLNEIGTHEMFQKLRVLLAKLIDLSQLYLYLGKVSFN